MKLLCTLTLALTLTLAALTMTSCVPPQAPDAPCPTCYLSPACVEDADGAPPKPAGTPCGAGACDGAGACCSR